MRTTIELPDELLQAAKVRAAERNETLKEFFARAIAQEVGVQSRRPKTGRVSLPLVKSKSRRKVDVTNEDIAAALDADDAERYTGP